MLPILVYFKKVQEPDLTNQHVLCVPSTHIWQDPPPTCVCVCVLSEADDVLLLALMEKERGPHE